jgi:hypothetical protein
MRTGEAYQAADDRVDSSAGAPSPRQLAALVEAAQAALAPFPDNRYTRMLREAPAAFAQAMERA